MRETMVVRFAFRGFLHVIQTLNPSRPLYRAYFRLGQERLYVRRDSNKRIRSRLYDCS